MVPEESKKDPLVLGTSSDHEYAYSLDLVKDKKTGAYKWILFKRPKKGKEYAFFMDEENQINTLEDPDLIEPQYKRDIYNILTEATKIKFINVNSPTDNTRTWKR